LKRRMGALPALAEIYLLTGTCSAGAPCCGPNDEITIDTGTGLVTDSSITIVANIDDTITGPPTFQESFGTEYSIVWNNGSEVFSAYVPVPTLIGYEGGPLDSPYYYDADGGAYLPSDSELTAVPEPSTLTLLLPTLIGLVFVALKHRGFSG
jgi:hypothetical protein